LTSVFGDASIEGKREIKKPWTLRLEELATCFDFLLTQFFLSLSLSSEVLTFLFHAILNYSILVRVEQKRRKGGEEMRRNDSTILNFILFSLFQNFGLSSKY